MHPSILYGLATICIVPMTGAKAFKHIDTSTEAGNRSASEHVSISINTSMSTNSSFIRNINCAAACKHLSSSLPSLTSFPNSTLYNNQSVYWSEIQTATLPHCRFTPFHPTDINTALRAFVFFDCPFAVKAGGHGAFLGASNIAGGVTIDLSSMHNIVMSSDTTTVSIGAGARWGSVYEALDPHNTTVVGGRVSDVGVGGLTLGGGISYFSGAHGWACDNVRNYEIVLANGTIANVNYTSDPELYWALRGGGNNFGIVTRFDMRAIPQSVMFGGQTFYSATNIDRLYDALVGITAAHESDPAAALYVAYTWVPVLGSFLASTSIEYSTPFDLDAPATIPSILGPVLRVTNLSSTLRNTTLASLTVELNTVNPYGLRQSFRSWTVGNNASLLLAIKDVYAREIVNIANITGIVPSLIMQPISTAMMRAMEVDGGNALGLDAASGNLILVLLSLSWSNATDDVLITTFSQTVEREAEALSSAYNASSPYIYQNYAAEDQNVFAGYGAANLARLRRIRKRVDPGGVFGRLQPGYFKL